MACSAVNTSTGSKVMPARMPVCVIMQARTSENPWIDESWSALAVTVSAREESDNTSPSVIFHQQDSRQVLYPGFQLELHLDECESYYHNLMSPQPGCFIIADSDNEEGTPVPIRITMSFDEAHAYLEGDAEIFAVPIPPELYRWTEEYVLQNYFPEQKKKRKNTEWKQDGGRLIR